MKLHRKEKRNQKEKSRTEHEGMKEKLKKRRPTKQESKVKGNSSRRIEPVLSLALELQEKVRKG